MSQEQLVKTKENQEIDLLLELCSALTQSFSAISFHAFSLHALSVARRTLAKDRFTHRIRLSE